MCFIKKIIWKEEQQQCVQKASTFSMGEMCDQTHLLNVFNTIIFQFDNQPWIEHSFQQICRTHRLFSLLFASFYSKMEKNNGKETCLIAPNFVIFDQLVVHFHNWTSSFHLVTISFISIRNIPTGGHISTHERYQGEEATCECLNELHTRCKLE